MSKRKSSGSTELPEKKIRREEEENLCPVQAISEADLHMIFTMFCWGSTIHGELGIGGVDQDNITTPHKLEFSQAANVSQVACGESHTVMLTRNGKVYSCGNNDYGQLGHDKSRTKPELVDKLESNSMTAVCCGGQHTLACNEWGQLFGWGSDAQGQLGLTGDTQPTPKIIKALATVHIIQAACGHSHSLALTSGGELYAWGENGNGQLGVGQRGPCKHQPQRIASLNGVPIAFIACGAHHSFAVSKSGAVFGWGLNSSGQLGLSDTESRNYPTHLKTLRSLNIKYIACGEEFSVFLSADGGVFTCGAGTYGQLGHGSPSNELLPRKIMELMGSTVTQVSCGRRHTLALVPSRGHVYAFGLGGCGQLGTRTSRNATSPQVVMGPWVSPGGVSMLGNTGTADSVVVTHLYSGGNQCFATVAKVQENVKPDDMRIFKEKSQVLTIHATKIAQCQKIPVDVAVDQDILSYLEIVFQSLNCFNGSFLTEDDRHYCCSRRNHGVDWELAERMFADISRIENETVKDLIWDGITASIMPSLSSSPPDVEAMRVYLVLPLYHHFQNPKKADKLQGPYARVVANMAGPVSTALSNWWLHAPIAYFERLIRVYTTIVAYHLQQVEPPVNRMTFIKDVVLESLKLLTILNVLNKKYGVNGPLLPYETFHIPELNGYDIESDYVEWYFHSCKNGNSGLNFLCNYPFLFDAQTKTSLLQVDQKIQMHRAMYEASRNNMWVLVGPMGGVALTEDHFLCFKVDRNNLVQSTVNELMLCRQEDLKKPLRVKFLGEEAEDGGGVKKEFFLLIMKEVLDPKFGMFTTDDETHAIWFNEVSFEDNVMYALIGTLCGLAMYNFTIIDLPFPLALYKKLLKEEVTYHDLKGLSPALFKSLQHLSDYTGDDLEDVFSLTFEITREKYGEVKNIELKENGSKIAVVQSNKHEYIDLYANYLLNKSIANQFDAFSEGFNKVMHGGRVLELFTAQELMALVVGNENYDWEAFEANTEYKGIYNAQHPTIRLFWEVFHELSHEEKKMFLLFLTGTDRIPIHGMKGVKIVIQSTNDDKYLPVAHTCFNLLDLPPYMTKERLRYKLQQAIKQHQGFSLV